MVKYSKTIGCNISTTSKNTSMTWCWSSNTFIKWRENSGLNIKWESWWAKSMQQKQGYPWYYPKLPKKNVQITTNPALSAESPQLSHRRLYNCSHMLIITLYDESTQLWVKLLLLHLIAASVTTSKGADRMILHTLGKTNHKKAEITFSEEYSIEPRIIDNNLFHIIILHILY